MFTITQLFIYPIKSLGGISLQQARIADTGFAYDRYWMLIEQDGTFITQREIPDLALFKLTDAGNSFSIRYNGQEIAISKEVPENESANIACTIFGKEVAATRENTLVSEWFSDLLKTNVQLVRKSSTPKRLVKNHPNSYINFPDASQYLILGESSLDHLNEKLATPLPMNRFRPNIVFRGGTPHVEDSWKSLQIGDAKFEITKACGRCKITTIDQESGVVGEEPLKTLSTYRLHDRNILFGQYLKLLDAGNGVIQVGDQLRVR
jgi:uncharacterized protein YcbX